MGLLSNLCNLLNEQKNLYAIRGLYRVIQLCKTKITQFSEQLSQVLQKFIHDTAKDENDQSPNYIYILFETTALSLKFMRSSPQDMANLQNNLASSLNFIIEHNKTELMGYAFQIYALFVASSDQNNEVFQALVGSILQNKENWNKDMKYLIPSLGQFLIAMLCKFPDYMKQFVN
jgi:hypothetical protein